MRKLDFKMILLLMGVLAVFATTSCEKDNDKPEEKKDEAKYLIGTTLKNPDGMSGSSYMQLIKEFSGSIDNSKATPVSFGCGLAIRRKEIFEFPSSGKDGDYNLKKYSYNGTTAFGAAQKLLLAPNSGASNITVVNDEKYYIPASYLGIVYIINPKTMKKIGQIDLTSYAHSDNNPDLANGVIRDGIYYLCLNQIGSDWLPYPDYHQVDVALIDTKTDKVLKVISEKTLNLSFPTYWMDLTQGMIFTNEQKDIYIACVGKFGSDPTYLNSGFVCIPAGKQEFDISKSWDISNTQIAGTNYKPSSMMNCKYIGNGKIAAYVTIMELMDPNNIYTSKNIMAVIIDMKAKTIKQIKGVPLTDGNSVIIEKYKDLVVFGAYGKNKAGFFTYNPQTEEVKHVLTTVGNPSFFHYFE